MRIILYIIVASCIYLASCTRSDLHYSNDMDAAEKLIQTDTDSAVSILDAIDPSELVTDSLRAKYHYLKAWGHMRKNRSMISDSMISFAHKYYSGKDIVRDIRSGTAMAWYRFWTGDTEGAINMFDSLSSLNDVPDSLMVQILRIRVLLGAAEYQGKELVPLAKRLIKLESDTLRKLEAKYMLVGAYEYSLALDSALSLTDELIEYARVNRWGDKQFYFELERAQILTEMGRNSDSEEVIAKIFRTSSPDNGAADYLHIQSAMNALNSGNTDRASRELALADSFSTHLRGKDDPYYKSYSNLLHALIDFKKTGRIKLAHINGLNNRERERYNRMEASRWESERGALQQQSRAMRLKAESGQKTVAILIIVLVSVLLLSVAGFIIRYRMNRERENEERAEALQKMVEELKSSSAQPGSQVLSALRRAMLQQLGIIKMVAETPTEQNREMLRRISSIDGDTDGALVSWNNIFELINNLYSGFYDKLHSQYGDTLSVKEEQIIVLMMAAFSTKEISVITGQTTSTVYVRKSSIRKKLGVPEKEDIVAFLRERFYS